MVKGLAQMGVINITDRISYIKATKLPLSSDVFIIEGDECVYLYDVGCNEENLNYINSINKPVKVILSHFHPDHTGNLDKITADTVYGGKATKKYFPNIICSRIFRVYCLDIFIKFLIKFFEHKPLLPN